MTEHRVVQRRRRCAIALSEARRGTDHDTVDSVLLEARLESAVHAVGAPEVTRQVGAHPNVDGRWRREPKMGKEAGHALHVVEGDRQSLREIP